MNVFEAGQMLLIDKPKGWTSFSVIGKVRKLTGVKKVGHAGTLDPLASGLLIVCTGKFTKQINTYMAQEKEYTGAITLGATTPTFDLESIPENHTSFSHLTPEVIIDATHRFTGEVMQVPPVYSAIKQDGKRLYALARKGVEVTIAPRKLFISTFEITGISLPGVSFRVVCSTGTYIRSLANDFGAALGCGGYLSGLCRTRIGTYELKDALTIEQLEETAHRQLQAKTDS